MIRAAVPADREDILELYAQARRFMRTAGNPTQWGEVYPPVPLVEEDIRLGRTHVWEEAGRIQAVFALIPGEDPTYREIDGAWLNDRPYAAVHRVASRGEIRGLAGRCLGWCLERYGNIRIDTHDDNLPMQRALAKAGFCFCGRIVCDDGTPRIAYQRVLEPGDIPLTLEKLTDITRGCLAIHETDSGFRFQRMTGSQLAAVDHIDRYRMRARFPAGVRFDFLTDGGGLSFDYQIHEFDPNRDFFGIDLYVDGVMVHTQCEKPIASRRGRFSCRWEGGQTGEPRRITVYLPISAIFSLSDPVLHGATRLEGAPRGGVLLCYGDSITQGYDALHPSLGYAAVLARSLGLDLLNQAISGYVFDPATIDAAHVPAPRRIIVAYGTNDWTNKGSLAEVRGDMDRYLDALVGAFPGCPIDLILPIWRGDCGEMTAVGSFPEVLEELAASAGRYPNIRVHNGQQAVPHCADFFADGLLHPNDTGMLLYAQWLAARISEDSPSES